MKHLPLMIQVLLLILYSVQSFHCRPSVDVTHFWLPVQARTLLTIFWDWGSVSFLWTLNLYFCFIHYITRVQN